MKKTLFLLCSLSIMNLAWCFQDSTSKPKFKLKDKLFFNMGGGVNFNNVASIISLNPQLGYRVTDKFITGIGANYNYVKYNNSNFSNSFYGGNAFARYLINDNIFLQSEYQLLTRDKSNVWDDYWLVGGGASIGPGLFASIFYIVDPPANNVYNSPFVYRIGYGFLF